MKKRWNRLISASLALVLAGSLTLPALAEEVPEVAADPGESAQPFSITVGSYTPAMSGAENIQRGETYTLLALPLSWAGTRGDGNVATLTPAELLSATGQALFIGSAVAADNGKVTFEEVRLRTADAVVYYVTGPGLDAPLYEATNTSTYAYGSILTDTPGDHSATITLVDATTGYRYGSSVMAGADGAYSLSSVAPGSYDLLVTKPGYLPTTRQAVNLKDGGSKPINLFNLSSNPYTPVNQSPIAGLSRVGDVTNDGARNMEDLAALLLYYGREDAVPQGVTADLNGDGTVNQADVTLLLTAAAKPSPKDITTGTAENVTGAKLTVSDGGGAADSTLRSLSFAVNTTATVSAAAFSITYRTDAVQPLNQKGGLVAPVDGGSIANCLVPASGVVARLTGWKVAGELTTLSFVLTADTPRAAGELARFYYRPVSGSANDFYRGVFTLPHAVAVVGKDTVVTEGLLTYPGQDNVTITSLTIDQQPAPGEDAPSLTIPAEGRTAVLPLSATGRDGANTYRDLPGVTWSVERADGGSLDGISVERGLLTVTSSAVAGTVRVTARRDAVTSAALTVTLEDAPPTAYALSILKDGESCPTDAIGVTAGADDVRIRYTAVVYDQNGQSLDPQPQVEWLLSGAPAGVSVDSGELRFDGATPAGTYTFQLLAQAGNLQDTVALTLTVEPEPASLLVSGAQSALIPAPGSTALSLTYTITALDAQGSPIPLTDELEPSFSVSPADQGVDAARDPLSGEYVLTVTAAAPAGTYTLTAQLGDASGALTLTLQAPEEEKPVRAAMFQDGAPVQSAQFTFPAGARQTLTFTAQLLDAEDDQAPTQPSTWSWSISPAILGADVPAQGAEGRITLSDTLAVGSYAFDLIAADAGTGLAVTLPVTVTITPVLHALRLTAPERLTIPAQASLPYTLTVSALDTQGQPMPLPEDLVWSVVTKDTANAPAGVSVDSGVLTVTAAAVPGDVTVTVSDAAGAVKGSATIHLDPAGTQGEPVLVLYRQITVDGVTVEENAPVPAAPDAVDAKMGQRVEVTYSAVLVDQATGQITDPPSGNVKWLGAPGGAFLVDENAESGVYSAVVTAVCNGQSASASANVSLYPNITGLLLDFGDGAQPPYNLTVPNRGSRYYTATLLAKVTQEGVTRTVPVADLGLGEYDVTLGTALTGLYATLDKTAGVMNFTVDPAAVQNPTQAPTDGTTDIRFVQLYMDYFPGETLHSERLAFYLTPESSAVTTAILRRGIGSGVSFSFGTPKAGEVTTTAAGTLSNCYALELLDQYGNPVVGRTVEWSLTVPDGLMSGSTRLASIVEPGAALDAAYPSYVSIRRLKVSPQAPAGSYKLTLTAACEGMTCTLPIQLTVAPAPAAGDLDMSVSGSGAITIPMYYAQYNSATVNNNVNSATYTAILRTASGGELDLAGGAYSLLWKVTDAQGGTPTGVTVTPTPGAASATVKVSRAAQPTGGADEDKLQVTATLQNAQGATLATGSIPVELNRSASVPTLMSIRKNGATVTSDSFTLASTDTAAVTRDYTFHLLDQYDQLATLKDRKAVTWTLSNSASSGVTLTTLPDEEGVPCARLTVKNPGSSVNKTVKLIASITIVEEKSSTGRQTISKELPISVTIGNVSVNPGGPSGPSLGGGNESSTPTTISISGNTYLNATQGTAASQTYSFTLRDASGQNASMTDRSKVTWSASGLTSGLTFNPSTHVLTVPASTPAGVYKVILTARYSASVSTSVTVTVNVANPTAGTPTSISITGTSSIITTQGTAVTKAWSASLRDATGAAVTVPQGSVVWSLAPLTNGALTVTFDASTATLTVPATASSGTLNATLTATYGSLKATLPLNITVSPAQTTGAAAAPTIVPTLVSSGTSGSVTLTAQQEKAITDSTIIGGVITIAPTGATNLTSATVTLSAATVKAMSGQKAQSLRLKTSLGTVFLPAQALAALASQGGSSVSVTIAASAGAVNVTFTCGHEAVSLPGSIALSVPTSGNVALKVSPDGAKDVIKKAVVKDGAVLTYLQGSAQLQLETRTPTFVDAQNHWAKEAIAFTAARELFQGTSATTFAPDDTMTRSMVVTVLHRLEDTPAATATAHFADVAQGTWYTNAVDWANAKGIVQGTDAGFRPVDPVTREQLATILYRYVSNMGLSTAQRASLTRFSDSASVSSWASDAMQWAVGVGLINGKTGGVLDPTGNASRAEVSTILQRLIVYMAPSV